MSEQLFSEFPPVSFDEWLDKINADLKGKPLDRLKWKTEDGIELFPATSQQDLPGFLANGQSRFPAPPKAGWKVHHVFTSASPDAVAELLVGENDFSLDSVGFRLDAMMTQTGAAAGYRSESGIQARTVADIEKLVAAVSGVETEIHMEAGLAILPAFAALVRSLRKSGKNPAAVQGTADNDPLAAGAVGEKHFKYAAAIAQYCKNHLPHYKGIKISLSWAAGAGATPVQQIAWALATLVEYIEQFGAFGLSPEDVVNQTSVEFAVGTDFYGEIAKLRAFRFLVPEILRQYNLEPRGIPVHGRMGESNLSALDPHVNMLRATTCAMAAVIGGATWVSTPSFDELSQSPGRFSARIARNVQHLLREESYLDRVADPAGGSWHIEHLTAEMAKRAWNLFQELEQNGGIAKAMENHELLESLITRKDEVMGQVSKRKKVMVGANQFPLQGQNLPEKPEKGGSKEQNELVNPFGLSEDIAEALNASTETLIGAIEGKLTDDQWIFPIAYKMIGSMMPRQIGMFRPAVIFERIYRKFSGQESESEQVKVFLFTFGDVRARMGRLGFSRDLFGVLGCQTAEFSHPGDMEKGLAEANAFGANIIVLCSSDEEYGAEGLEWLNKLRQKNSGARFVIAGSPPDKEKLGEAGVNYFISAGMNVVDFAEELLSDLKGGAQ